MSILFKYKPQTFNVNIVKGGWSEFIVKNYISKNEHKKTSQKMCFMLRHKPEDFDITLFKGGWAKVPQVLFSLNIYMFELKGIVSSDNKGRYSFNEDKTRIRANQGHSIDIDLGLDPVEPPKFLYHGTVEKYMHLIEKSGLKKMARHHVHLSQDLDTATVVASRRKTGNLLLTVDSKEMFKDGFDFYVTENNVWLTNNVPFKYISVPK